MTEGKAKMKVQRIEIKDPLIIMFQSDEGTVCRLSAPEGYGHEMYGLLVCDIVRNVADAFKVDEDSVWEWVDKERHHHTTDIRHPTSARQWMQEFMAKKN
jgi:hypothetical protein